MLRQVRKEDTKDRILQILREHPEGLYTKELKKKVGLSSTGLSRHLYQLIPEIKKVQTSKLCEGVNRKLTYWSMNNEARNDA